MALQSKVKAAIKRASKLAREQGNVIDKKTLDALTALFRNTNTRITELLLKAASENGIIKLTVLKQLLSSIQSLLNDFQTLQEQLLYSAQEETAQTAVTPFAVFLTVQDIKTATNDALQSVRTFFGNDGLQLSDRIWRVNKHAKEVVTHAIESAIIQGHSASRLTDEFEHKGLSVPREIKHNIAGAQANNIAKVTTKELMKESGSPYQNALRLFRTEINRAHGLAYQKAAFETNEVIGTRFLLSPNHTETDICDMHAKVNRYGLGAGVYPKGKSPWPAHPNTLSYTQTKSKCGFDLLKIIIDSSE